MNQNSTKAYSSRQEKMIQDYLGWQTVSASGARPFHPGDVKSDKWLSECKTHTKVVERIAIVKSVWSKISTEAMSVFKHPILFVDNGTQKSSNTWCVFEEKFLPSSDNLTYVDIKIRDSSTKITFDHFDMMMQVGEMKCGRLFINGQNLVLMRLSTFKDLTEVE